MPDWTEVPADSNDAESIEAMWDWFQAGNYPDTLEDLYHATVDPFTFPWQYEWAWDLVSVPRDEFMALLTQHYPNVPTSIVEVE